MRFSIGLALAAAGLLAGMLLLLELGRRLGARRFAKDPAATPPGLGAIEGAVFALLGLLVAFTFSGAASRFDARRQLVAQEANAIGTAYLRLDLLPAEPRDALRQSFRKYLQSRVDTYRKLPDIQAAYEELARSRELQDEIWTRAVNACNAADRPSAGILLLPALNEMIDITTTRTEAARIHPPITIFALLFGLALGCSLLAGYAMGGGKRRSWTHMIGFAAVMSITFFVILDIEYPRLGLIRADASDQVLVELLQSMK